MASSDSQGRATVELATIAAAWALLHELRHIRHQRERTGASPFSDDRNAKHREELSCDAFATRFLLDQADNYSIREGVKVELVTLRTVEQRRQRKSMGGKWCGKWSGTEVKIEGVDILIMKESDIMGGQP